MIEHQSAYKFTLADARSNVLVDCIGNTLKDAIWGGNKELSEMGLQIPSKVIVERNQTKSMLDFNWEKYQNKSLVDLI